MSHALAIFFRRALDDRGETADQFAKRTGLNSSGLYQILREERQYVQDRTLDKIAAGLDMTPAEMAVAMGKAVDADPDEAELVALFRQVPPDQRPAAKHMLRGLAVQPINRGPDKRDRRRADSRHAAPSTEIEPAHKHQGEDGPEDDVIVFYERPGDHRVRSTRHLKRRLASSGR